MTLAFRTAAGVAASTPRERAPHGASQTATGLPPVHDARRLTGTGQTGYITLDDKTYVLRITRAGKLILTK